VPTEVSSNPATRTHRLLSSAASVNATVAVSRRARLIGIQGFNARGSAVYLKLYDKKTAPSEADTPVRTLYLPASSPFDFSRQVQFKSGISYRMTTAVADNSTAALTAGDVLALNIDYV
jgi:hypothetical protein